MRLNSAFLQLPLHFDAAVVVAELDRLPEAAWRPHPERHAGNSALPLVARDGDPGNDDVDGAMRPTPWLAQLPSIQRLMAALQAPIGRSRLMRLDGNAEATAHCDVNVYWQDRHRVHLPIVTTADVRFLCGEEAVHMAVGECWVFDTTRRHNVINPQPTRRIHLVVDTVGSKAFSQLLARARDPRQAPADFTPAPIVGTGPVALRFESRRRDAVMNPWELQARLDAALRRLALTVPGMVGAFSEAWRDGLAQWHALWVEHADAASGHGERAAVLADITATLAPLRGQAVVEGIDMVDWVAHTALRPALAAGGAAPSDAGTPVRAPVAAPAAVGAAPRSPGLSRPVFIISPPRSGSSLLFETLALAPGLASIGRESHALIEGIPGLAPRDHGFDSNLLPASAATPEVVEALNMAFQCEARNRDGHPIAATDRLLEKTPKNALRVRFLAAAFPDAQFIYLYRDPRETLASMIDAWSSGRFVTYPELPGWSGPAWSMLLTPGWRDLAGRPLAEIAARQWAATVEQALDDLHSLAPERWCLARYDALVAEPQAEVARLCAFLDIDWDRPLGPTLPLSRTTLSSPDPDKWKRHAEALATVRPYFEPAANRLGELFASPPAIVPPRRRAPTQAAPLPSATPTRASADAEAYRSASTPGFAELLQRLGITLAVSTYQSGRLILLRADGEQLNTHLRHFARPMGIALGQRGLALGAAQHVHRFRNQPAIAAGLEPRGRHDACFLPASAHVTGDIRVHELAFDADDELWVVNTRFSCLCTLDDRHSFVPRWRPRFVSALAPEDRCHLNGLAMRDGRPWAVSVLGASDVRDGWRERKFDGGQVLEIDSGAILAHGLAMPHSPRWHRDRLWVLESARGAVVSVDLASGQRTTVAELPGFTRGLAFVGPYAFVGLSQVRESLFDGLPLAQRVAKRQCGVCVLDLRSGALAAMLRFEGKVEEIFDVQVLPWRYPDIAETEAEVAANAFVLPDAALTEVRLST